MEKITDLQLQQGCVQRCFDIHEIQVQTASNTSESGPEMRLIGLTEPMATRSKILKVRDSASGHLMPQGNQSGPNPLLPAEPVSTKELQTIMSNQNETMVEIRDVLQDMKAALVYIYRIHIYIYGVSHDKFSLQILITNSHYKFSLQILIANSHYKFPLQILFINCFCVLNVFLLNNPCTLNIV